MALEAKDFHLQAQWALVAIPAPIYFVGLRRHLLRSMRAWWRIVTNQLFSLNCYRPGMINRKPFGKLGKRGLARVSTGLDATLVLPDRSARCRMTDISRTGCRVQVSEPLRIGVTVLVRIERIEEIGTIVWTKGTECGVKFGRPIAIQALARIRWMVEHSDDQERRMMASATAIWR